MYVQYVMYSWTWGRTWWKRGRRGRIGLCTNLARVVNELPVAVAATRRRHSGELHVDQSPLVVDDDGHPAVDERVDLADHVKVTLGAHLALDLLCLQAARAEYIVQVSR